MSKRCSFKNCQVKQNEKVCHRYPKDEKRCEEWILRSGNIDMDYAQAKNKLVCANHFRPKDFLDPKGKRLNKLAMPQFYDCDDIDNVQQVQLSCEDGQVMNSHVQPPQDQPPHVQPPQDQPPHVQPPQDQPLRTLNVLGSLMSQNPRPISPKLVLMEVTHNGQVSTGIDNNNSSVKSQSFMLFDEAIPSNLSHSSQVPDDYNSKQVHDCIIKQVTFDMEKRKLLMRIKTQSALLRKHRKTIRKMKAKLENPPKPGLNRLIEELSKHVPSDYVMSFIRMQVLHGVRRPWTQIEKEMALSFYIKSPKGYLYIRKKGIQLPNRRTIQRWKHDLRNMEPGLLSPEVCVEEEWLEDECVEPVDL